MMDFFDFGLPMMLMKMPMVTTLTATSETSNGVRSVGGAAGGGAGLERPMVSSGRSITVDDSRVNHRLSGRVQDTVVRTHTVEISQLPVLYACITAVLYVPSHVQDVELYQVLGYHLVQTSCT